MKKLLFLWKYISVVAFAFSALVNRKNFLINHFLRANNIFIFLVLALYGKKRAEFSIKKIFFIKRT